jgi:uncharacterized protein (DUF39 family)
MSDRTIYTYMGVLRPRLANGNYSTSGQLSPLFNDPFYKTIGLGTRIFLGGAQGYVSWSGTQHNPNVERNEKGIPKSGAGTIATIGDLKKMSPQWLAGASILGYGVSLYVGIGIPIPILNEEMARYTGIKDEDIITQVYDYSMDYPKMDMKVLAEVNYKDLRSGAISVNGKKVTTAPLSSYYKAREICQILKEWIQSGEFLLGEPQMLLPPPASSK